MTKTRQRILWGSALAFTLIAVPAGVWASGSHIAGLHGFAAMHGHHDKKAPETVEEVRTHLARAADLALCGPDVPTAICGTEVSDDQRAEVDAVLDELAPTLFDIHREAREVHQGLRHQMEQSQPDAAAIEVLRQRAVALADRGSKSLMEAMLQASDILSPEQRRRLHEKIAALHGEH